MPCYLARTCLLLLLVLLLSSITIVSTKPWPVLYPAISEKNLLVFNTSSSHLLDGHSAFKWFYCADSSTNSKPPLTELECDPSLVIMISKPRIRLALSAVDENGLFTILGQSSIPIVKVNESEAIIKESPRSHDFSIRSFRARASVEYEFEVLLEEQPVTVSVSFGDETRSVRLFLDKRQPTWKWKLRQVEGERFECVVYFSEATFSSIGTYCDKRLEHLIPTFIDWNGRGYYSRDNNPGPLHPISTLLQSSTPCVEDRGMEKSLSVIRLFANYSNAEPESLKAILSANRKMLHLTGKFKPLTNATKEIPKELTSREISLIIRKFSLMDFAGNQLTESIAVEGNATRWWLWSHETGQEVGFVTSRTALATSAIAALTYLTPSYGGHTGIVESTGHMTDLLTMGQKVYFIGLIGQGAMPANYEQVSSYYGSYAFNIRLPWDKAKKNKTSETPKTFKNKTNKKASNETTDKFQTFKKSLDLLDVVESFELRSEKDPYKALLQVLFYVAVVYLIVCFARCSIIGAFWLLDKDTPSVLIFPRLEIIATFWVAPAIAAKCPDLLSKGAGGYVLAVVVFGLFPGLFLCLQAAILYLTFFKQEPIKWRVRLVSVNSPRLIPMNSQDSLDIESQLSEDRQQTEIKSSSTGEVLESSTRPMRKQSPGQHEVSSSVHEIETIGASTEATSAISLTLFDRLVRPLVGPPIDKTKWETVHHDDRFLHRFGPLFEDFRAPDCQTKDTSSTNTRARWSFYRCGSMGKLFALATAFTDSFKLILLALVCSSELPDMVLGQLTFALCLSFGFLVFLRLLRPFRSRGRLAVVLLIEFVDCLTFILAIIAVTADRDDQELKEKCGFMMLCSQGVVYLLMVLEKASVACFRGFLFCFEQCKQHLPSSKQDST